MDGGLLMKFIHTGDWHIGKILNQVYMTEDQEYILNELINIVQDEKAEALVIAGDIYDRAVPPVEAIELLDKVFSKLLLELKVPILAIAGNHDSPDRVDFASRLVEAQGLYIEGKLKKDYRQVILYDEYGPVNFYLLPYAHPAEVRDIFEDDAINCHDLAMKKIIDNIKQKMSSDERNVIVAHGYIRGTEELKTCESEKPLCIGGSEYVDVQYFKAFNYTALGHLHCAQCVGCDEVRYAGSILKYSFSEARHNKSVTVVDIDGQGKVNVRLRPLIPKRDLRTIKGYLKELISPEVYSLGNTEDYIFATLTDEGELFDAMGKLRSIYPNILGLDREDKERTLAYDRLFSAQGFEQKSKLALFKEFYESISGQSFDEVKADFISGVLDDIERERREF